MTSPSDPNWGWEFRCENFVYARLAEAQTAADKMPPGPARDQELNRIDTLYYIADDHNIWVDARGDSAARCITCTPAGSGVPCQTMRGLARLWPQHPDYLRDWNSHIDNPRYRGATYEQYKKRTTIQAEREAELGPFYDRFDLKQGRIGEYWQCKTCGTRGEEQQPVLGAYDYPFAIGDAQRLHPTCQPALKNKEPTCEP